MIFRALPHKRLALFLAVLILFGSGFASVAAATGDQGEAAGGTPSAAALWQAAEEAVAAGDQEEAAVLFGRLHRRYREAEQAEESLWQEARLRHDLALGHEEADWEPVRDLYRLYVTEYPEGGHFEEAYLGLGLAHFQMHFFREAVIYLKFFLDRFPRSRLRDKASYWQGRTLVEIGRLPEAEQIYQELAAGEGGFRVEAKESLADLYFATARFQHALPAYEGLQGEFAPHTREHLEIIRKLGLTHARLGHEVACRDHLYRYLNVIENSPHQAAVLFELGESSWRAAETEAARRLYEQALAKARPGERAAVLSRFRLALAGSRRTGSLPAWEKPLVEEDDGDGPYQEVLDLYGREPIAQDARHALLRRLMARGEAERSLLLAKTYLNGPDGAAGQREEVAAILGKLLTGRVEKLLQAKEYRQVGDLYLEEHRYLSNVKEGRLLYLIGQAFEALGLFDQAAIVYYRALAGELSPEEKSDLYVRRARVYLAKGDYEAAERLLAYLRDIYAGRKEISEILDLSGRLRERQKKAAEAAAFYAEACGAAAAGEGGSSCLAQVRVLLQLDRVEEAAAALARSRQQNRMAPEALQQGLGELGDGWRRQGQTELGAAAYAAALGEGMPQEGQGAQRMHLGLADLCLKLGRAGEGIAHYEKARTGPDPLLARSAEEGLRLANIEKGVAASRSLDLPVDTTP